MKVELGEHIKTADGEDAGVIRHLILNPDTCEVTAIVVERGLLLKDDIEVPIADLTAAPDSEVRIARTEKELEDLPRFRRTAEIPKADEPHDFPAAGVFWPAAYPGAAAPNPYGFPVMAVVPPDVLDAPESVPEPNTAVGFERREAVLSAGDDVVSRDGEKIGEISHVTFDATTGRPIRLAVRRGFLFKEDVEISSDILASVADGTLFLNVDRDHFQQAA